MSLFETKILGSEKEIIYFRKKVYNVAFLMMGNAGNSNKIASFLSSYLRMLQQHFPLLILTIDYEHIKSNNISTFKIGISSSLGDPIFPPPIIKSHLFHIDVFDTKMVMTIKRNFDTKNLYKAVEFYNEKSRDELLDELKVKNDDLKESYENLKKAKNDKARMESELSVGRNIQMSMLPKNFFQNDHISLFADLIPAREVGGDFYDFQLINNRYLYIVIGDVSDKGVPAALLMAMTKSLLKSAAQTEISTAEIMSHVNNQIVEENKNNMFVTVFMGMLDVCTGKLTYTNAGHNPSFIRSGQNLEVLKEIHGPIIGVMKGLDYKERTVQLQENDVVYAYTDGVPEARNRDKVFFTDQKLQGFVKNTTITSMKQLVEDTIHEVRVFEDGFEQADDITVLCLKFKKKTTPLFTTDLKPNFDQKNKLNEQLQVFFNQNELDETIQKKLFIVFDEVISNQIKYGFEGIEIPKIHLYLEIKDKELSISVKDNGIAFNPFLQETPNTTSILEERESGGLGIHIVKQLMDSYNYHRKDDKNIIQLNKIL
ncbi:SpoIIE family protein phosphatase [Flammeovirga yaeyamensis]|uniref:SpoIIE family protein phosphatase n=1 Tax=Flammeovirga yaeyamensis TaxID=367791 RepID=A0AAX1NBJ6_9BACT|nr:SpoIIE family protein phosphatase [Flammeovirga yaeyamensis]MBB3697122.1 sigma-B regulation protein RsbU (phosphoserine phosphatase) [Flammeovirga yaeyamensis]NMF33785.1 SpoIIE family protein phosphatase [Flammeovirga yaeyamensis]QWG04950.1 SpoIIE family protein phosphatase [Flammeovirga yaeyamensis]